MTYRIRRARDCDKDAIRELDWEAFPDDPDADLEDPLAMWWVATYRGKVVAYAGMRAVSWSKAWLMHRSGVSPRHRGKGLQRRLIGVRVRHARREGVREVWTHTTHRNVVSSNNLLRAGFRLWMPAHWHGSVKPWKPEGDYAFLYWKLRTERRERG